jgi:uncharacterized protein with GYD domain
VVPDAEVPGASVLHGGGRGRPESIDFAFGSDDVVIILELPSNVDAAAIGIAVAASGALTTRMTVLLTPEEIDEATRKSVDYRAPGG